MIKKLLFLISILLFFIFPVQSFAYTGPTFVTFTNPVRGHEGWLSTTQEPLDIPIKLYHEASTSGLPSTWLLRYDAVNDASISAFFNSLLGPDILVSIGGLLEVTPRLTQKINLNYSGGINKKFLSGYTPSQRILLIDAFMDSFKTRFGYFPRTVGAWYLDSFSLDYLKTKYSVQTAMMLDDQYQTGGIRLWGGYLGSPYFPDKNNSLIPAENFKNRINIPVVRFAQRDLFNILNPQKLSLFSIEPNDYQNLGLSTNYFNNLLALYTQKGLNKFTYLNIGLENDLFIGDYLPEIRNILSSLKENQEKYNIRFSSLEYFGDWMKSFYPESSPVYFYRTTDPSGNESGEVVWYQTPYYRLGLKTQNGQTKITDFRVYNRQIYEDYFVTANQNYGISAEIPAEIDSIKYPGTSLDLNLDLENYETAYDEVNDIWKIALVNGNQKITLTPKTITFTNIKIPKTNFENIKETINKLDTVWTVSPKPLFKDQINYSWLFWVLVILLVNFVIKKSRGFKMSRQFIPVIIGLACIAIVSLSVIRSGLVFPFGLGFWGPNGHDAIFHLSLIEKFAQNPFNLNHPQFANIKLTNYHFVFDYFSGILVWIFQIPAITFYFRVAPIILGIILVFLLNKLMLKRGYSNFERSLGFILVFLSGSLGFIPKLLTNQNIFSGESAFWANQSASLFLNPPFVLSLIFLLLFLINLPSEGKIKTAQFIKLVFFGAILSQTKVYAFVLLTIALLLTRRFKLLLAIGIVGALITIPFSSFSGSPFSFDPLWFTKSLFASLDRFSWPKLVQAWQVYEATGNLPKLMAVNIFAVIVFIVGNLGVRLIGLLYSFKEKQIDVAQKTIFWLIISGLILPLIIVQKVNPWNTIQFMYYSLFFLGLITAKAISTIASSIKNTSLKIGFIVVILFLATATSVGTLKDYIGSLSSSRVGYTELRALNLLRSLPKGTVLSPYFNSQASWNALNPRPLYSYTSTAYISALSGQPEFLSDTINLDITGYNYQERAKEIQRFYNTADSNWAKNFLLKNNIKYIYETPLKRFNLNPDSLSLTKIFDSGEINIYQTN